MVTLKQVKKQCKKVWLKSDKNPIKLKRFIGGTGSGYLSYAGYKILPGDTANQKADTLIEEWDSEKSKKSILKKRIEELEQKIENQDSVIDSLSLQVEKLGKQKNLESESSHKVGDRFRLRGSNISDSIYILVTTTPKTIQMINVKTGVPAHRGVNVRNWRRISLAEFNEVSLGGKLVKI